MKRWNVWAERCSRDDAAVVLAWSAGDAAASFVESEDHDDEAELIVVHVAAVDSQEVETHRFAIKTQDDRRRAIDAVEREIDRRIDALVSSMDLASDAFELGSKTGAIEAIRDLRRWLSEELRSAAVVRSASDDAPRRPGSVDGEAGRREAAGD
jgi:hypothetical protein